MLAILMALIGCSAASASETVTTHADVTTGMKCAPNSRGDMECDYRVGRSLHFGVVGVGKPDASIYFYSASFEGDYFAVVGLSHGCVIVRPGKALGQARTTDLAFVSPQNGMVYRDWQACDAAK
jgi:hypothetical protein